MIHSPDEGVAFLLLGESLGLAATFVGNFDALNPDITYKCSRLEHYVTIVHHSVERHCVFLHLLIDIDGTCETVGVETTNLNGDGSRSGSFHFGCHFIMSALLQTESACNYILRSVHGICNRIVLDVQICGAARGWIRFGRYFLIWVGFSFVVDRRLIRIVVVNRILIIVATSTHSEAACRQQHK